MWTNTGLLEAIIFLLLTIIINNNNFVTSFVCRTVRNIGLAQVLLLQVFRNVNDICLPCVLGDDCSKVFHQKLWRSWIREDPVDLTEDYESSEGVIENLKQNVLFSWINRYQFLGWETKVQVYQNGWLLNQVEFYFRFLLL
jgi:hypothetical protein